MKIEGQTLPEIFAKLPWQYKIVTVLGGIFVVFAIGRLPFVLSHIGLNRAPVQAVPIGITGVREDAIGALDPSLAFDPKTQKLWLATTLVLNENKTRGKQTLMNIRLAMPAGSAGCQDWMAQRPGELAAKEDTLLAPDSRSVLRGGLWRYETPSLIYDPGDEGKEWKLFAYRYFWPYEQKYIASVMEHYGAITYIYAPTPSGPWSVEQWIFSAAPGYPPTPYQESIRLHLNRLDPSLKDITAYTRPSALAKDGMLLMTLSAFKEGLVLDRIVMIGSLDHGKSWRYIGTPLTAADLPGFTTDTYLFGATFFAQEGALYLAVMTGTNNERGPQHTTIFPFVPGQGVLQRNAQTGAPVPARTIDPLVPGMASGGGVAYNDVCKDSFLTTVRTARTGRYQVYISHTKPVPATPDAGAATPPPPATPAPTEGKK